MSTKPIAAGKSSYDLIDQDRFWRLIALQPGMTVLDLGCGAGRYALPLAGRIGPDGLVLAVDLWAAGLLRLKAEAVRLSVGVIEACVADAGQALPFSDQSVDLCLMAAVLHDFAAAGIGRAVLNEVRRVMKPQGILTLVEFRKQDGPPGPPRKTRLSVEDLAVMLQPMGFLRFSAVADLGPDLYMTQFRRLGADGGARRSFRGP